MPQMHPLFWLPLLLLSLSSLLIMASIIHLYFKKPYSFPINSKPSLPSSGWKW